MNLKAQCAAPIQWQHARRVSPRTAITYLFSLVLASLFAGTVAASDTSQNTSAADRKDLITAVKRLERKLGFRRTKNFHTETAESAVAYRCYYTGKLELP